MTAPPTIAPAEPAIVDDQHPWPGLASFREVDVAYFKGRDADVDQLSALVNRERLTVLFGVSGLGKSSLLQAGLFPSLRQDNLLPITIRLDFTPEAPTLVQQVFDALTHHIEEKLIEAPQRLASDSLWEYFHRKNAEFWDSRNRITLPLLCFDQFEEVFTLGKEGYDRHAEIKSFLVELADLIEGRCPESVKQRIDANPAESKLFNFSLHPYKVLLSLREDYLADLEGLRKLMPSVIHNRMRLTPMNGIQAMTVADQTRGRLMDRHVAESVVRLVAGKHGDMQQDLSELRIEPALLSLVCRELNERRVTENADKIDAHSVSSNREQILGDFFDRSLSELNPAVRRFIEDKLITVSGYRNSEAYDNAIEMPGISEAAINHLVECRLLRIEERDGIKRIELIHDVLTGIARKSRDQRQILEKQRQAEQDRIAAEQREHETQEALRASKRNNVVFAVLTLFAIASSLWGWWSWWDAKEAHIKAKHALAVADFREARQHYEDNDLVEALAHLAHAIRLDPNWKSSRALLVNLLQQRTWHLPVYVLKHKSGINNVVFSPDNTRILSASQDFTAQVWDIKTGLPVGDAMRHERQVYSALYSPDGKRIITASEDHTVRLWDADTGKAIGLPIQGEDEFYFATFSPDGQRIATASHDGKVWLLDGESTHPLAEAVGHRDPVNVVQFSPDGTRFVTASEDNSARLWDAFTGKPIGKPMWHKGDVHFAHFSPDGLKIATASEDNSARLWDGLTAKAIGEPMTHQSDVYSAQFSPDNHRLVTVSEDRSARQWDANSGKPVGPAMLHQGYVYSAQYSPDGRMLATASGDHSARIWDTVTGKQLGGMLSHFNDVYSVQFSADGVHLVTGSEDGSARLWRVGKRLMKPTGLIHSGQVNMARFNSDGNMVLTASKDHSAVLWDSKTGKPVTPALRHGNEVNSAEFSPDGNTIVTASTDNSAALWDVRTGAQIGQSMPHPAEVLSASFSPDGKRILTVSGDHAVRLWQTGTGQQIGAEMRHQDIVNSAQFSPDGSRIVTASLDHTARLWDGNSGRPLCQTIAHEDSIRTAQFSPDGTRIVTASSDNTAKLWDVATCSVIGMAMDHQFAVNSAWFSADGARIVTASADNSARLWDGVNGKPLGEPMTHDNTVNQAYFSLDGKMVATVSLDKTARVWDGNTGKPLSDPIAHDDNVTWVQFSRDNSRIATVTANQVKLWDIYPVLEDNHEILPRLAEAVIGNRLTELNAVEPMNDQLSALNSLHTETIKSPSGLPTAEAYTKWFLSKSEARSVSPLSQIIDCTNCKEN